MNHTLEASIFIGGAPCSGKSTLAARLSRELGVDHYKCDDHFSRHLDEAFDAGREYATIAKSVTHEYIFMRSDLENFQFAIGIHSEEFEFILNDLAVLNRPLIVEGCSVVPELVAKAGVPRSNVVYLIPNESFHREKYAQDRPWAWDRLQETSNPEQAYENWMNRDAMLAKYIHDEALRFGYWVREVGHSTDFNALYSDVRSIVRQSAANKPLHRTPRSGAGEL